MVLPRVSADSVRVKQKGSGLEIARAIEERPECLILVASDRSERLDEVLVTWLLKGFRARRGENRVTPGTIAQPVYVSEVAFTPFSNAFGQGFDQRHQFPDFIVRHETQNAQGADDGGSTRPSAQTWRGEETR